MEVRKILEYALQREYEGKKFFEDNATRMAHPAAASAFRELAAEEEKHIGFIQGQIAALEKNQLSSQGIADELNRAGFFTARAHSELLDQTVLEAMVPDLPVLRTAYLIERDFAEFYESSAMKTDGEAKILLEKLSAWERKHEALFKSLHDKAYEAYNAMPWGG